MLAAVRQCPSLAWQLSAATSVWTALIACNDPTSQYFGLTDAAVDGQQAASDGSVSIDQVAPLLWVDFVATGCESGGFANEPCVGTAPLSLRFVAAASSAIDTHLWTFGDETMPDNTPSPVHEFNIPGAYDTALSVSGPGGTATNLRAGFVVAVPAPIGEACGLHEHCEVGLECVCGTSQTCSPSLANGFCSLACDAAACPNDTACVNLDPTGLASFPWSRFLCLERCEATSDCRADFVCQELLLGGSGGEGWRAACFSPTSLASLGESCFDPNGTPDGRLCSSGSCLPEGARGLCSADCASTACPGYATCATFAAPLGNQCLARCDVSSQCDDPWLACEAPGALGTKSFTVEEPAAPAGYCAPKSCLVSTDCGTDGLCTGGYCGPS